MDIGNTICPSHHSSNGGGIKKCCGNTLEVVIRVFAGHKGTFLRTVAHCCTNELKFCWNQEIQHKWHMV